MNGIVSQEEVLDSQKPAAVVAPDFGAVRAAGLDALAWGWCAWKYRPRQSGKPSKVPFTPDGDHLSVGSPERWASFEAVEGAYAAGGFDGIGLLMPTAKGLVGLDLDGCITTDGEVIDAKQEIVADFLKLGGYVEVSPSGTGLRQFLKGCRLEDFGNRGRAGTGLEVYDDEDARYLTTTGVTFPRGSQAGRVIANQSALEEFIARWCDPQTTGGGFVEGGPAGGEGGGSGRSVAEVLALLKKHNRRGRITRLLKGELGDHDGDHSAADLDLCQEVAYFCRDAKVIDAIMRGSGLFREKWDQKRGKRTYGEATVSRALEKQDRNFDADQAQKARQEDRATGEAAHLDGGGDDLRVRGGWRSDAWALVELLARDRRLLGAVFFDDFAGWPVVVRSLRDVLQDRSAPATVGRIQDAHLHAVARWFGRTWGLRVTIKDAAAAVEGWARVLHRNPVRERLEELGNAWDGVLRLDEWLIDYCGAVVTNEDGEDVAPFVRAAGSRWMLSVVARAMQPGCKADCMLILEGRQGARKSSAARALAEAVSVDAFREGFSLDSGGKDDLIALRGRLIVEWGELSGMGRKDREHLKNFLSQQTDSYRSVYGMTETDWPRTAVFLGTTNERHYLADPSGNRRFWPVTVGRIDLDKLRKDAEQLWGEAVQRYQAGGRWWFDDTDPRDAAVLALALGEQVRRVGGTLWGEVAAELADRLIAGDLEETGGGTADTIGAFSVAQIRTWLEAQAKIEITDTAWLRITDGLKAAGWEPKKSHGRMRWRLTTERREAGTLFLG